jgi:hypothetical protein
MLRSCTLTPMRNPSLSPDSLLEMMRLTFAVALSDVEVWAKRRGKEHGNACQHNYSAKGGAK